jgi:RNA polymerase sigma-70 factor (ECF subfamily)
MQATDQRVVLFEEIFYDTRDRLFGFAKKLLQDESKVQDCMQQCYMKLWEVMDRIDTRKELLPLLYTYARNNCIDQLRRNSRYVWLDDLGVLSEKLNVENEVEADIRLKDADRQIAGLFHHMSPRRRQVFTLIKLNGLSYREVSEHLNISISTVEKHMHEASKSLTPETLIKVLVFICILQQTKG